MSDVCVRKIKASYAKWPSARASQAVAKCRKARGIVRKGAEGKSLRRWGREKWKDTISGKACGAGEKAQYCRRIEADSCNATYESKKAAESEAEGGSSQPLTW